jgi:hypothetical protein
MSGNSSRTSSKTLVDAWQAPAAFVRPMNIQAAAGVGAAALAEVESVSRLSLRLFQERCTTAAAGLGAFWRCRTAEDVLAAQAALVCEDLDLIRRGCERLSEIISDAAGDAVRSLPHQDAEGAAPLA